MYINKKTGASYGFVAPEITEDNNKVTRVHFPTFGVVEPDLDSEGQIEINVSRTNTLIDLGEEALSDNETIIINASEELPQGSRCIVKWICGAQQHNVTISFGDNNSVVMNGIANNTVCYELIYFNQKWILLK